MKIGEFKSFIASIGTKPDWNDRRRDETLSTYHPMMCAVVAEIYPADDEMLKNPVFVDSCGGFVGERPVYGIVRVTATKEQLKYTSHMMYETADVLALIYDLNEEYTKECISIQDLVKELTCIPKDTIIAAMKSEAIENGHVINGYNVRELCGASISTNNVIRNKEARKKYGDLPLRLYY